MDEIIFTKRHNYRLYPESIKKAVVKEYESTNCSKNYLVRKYGLGGHITVTRWLVKYGSSDEFCTLEDKVQTPSMPTSSSKQTDKDARIQRLEHELSEAKLLAEAYKRMINIAEQKHGIKIKKK